METSFDLPKIAKGDFRTEKEKFKQTLKTLKEEKLEDFRILIEMELMERDRRK